VGTGLPSTSPAPDLRGRRRVSPAERRGPNARRLAASTIAAKQKMAVVVM
jgi:hypothetical protein